MIRLLCREVLTMENVDVGGYGYLVLRIEAGQYQTLEKHDIAF
ncbi:MULTISPECIES: hypothetical protein [unclassified Halomonas]|nr:hypothetical protein [Halomonas sp. JB37]